MNNFGKILLGITGIVLTTATVYFAPEIKDAVSYQFEKVKARINKKKDENKTDKK